MGRGRGRANSRGTRGRGRGRGKRTTRIVSSEEENSNETSNNEKLEIQEDIEIKNETFEEQPQQEPTPTILPTKDVEMVEEKEFEEQQPHKFDMEGDISKLEAPTFTTLTRNIPQPMTQLTWDHKVNLIGEKLISPMIHFCDQCNKPILIYGRMIPCKHVFCLKCARTDFKNCPRCNDKVVRVEKNGFPIYLCTHGGTLYGSTGCRRTYLSQRDLDAHIKHRHLPIQQSQEAKLASVANPPSNVIIQQHQRKDSISSLPPQNLPLTATHISVLQNSLQSQSTSRTNLISVALQDQRQLIPPSSQQSQQPHESSQLGHNLYYNQIHQTGSANSGGGSGSGNVSLPTNYSAGGVQMVMQPSQHNRPSQTASSYFGQNYGQQHYPPQHSQSQWNQQPYYR